MFPPFTIDTDLFYNNFLMPFVKSDSFNMATHHECDAEAKEE